MTIGLVTGIAAMSVAAARRKNIALGFVLGGIAPYAFVLAAAKIAMVLS